MPGDMIKSHLLKLVSSHDPEEKMPPKGEPLNAQEIALLQRWVETGAHWTDAATTENAAPLEASPELKITEKDRQFWSFVLPKQVEPDCGSSGRFPPNQRMGAAVRKRRGPD